MWEFHAAGGAPKFSWTWACYGGRPFSARRSETSFHSYHEVIADATRHGFNIVTDRWRIITPSDGIPLYDSAPHKPLYGPVGLPAAAGGPVRGRRSIAGAKARAERPFEKQF